MIEITDISQLKEEFLDKPKFNCFKAVDMHSIYREIPIMILEHAILFGNPLTVEESLDSYKSLLSSMVDSTRNQFIKFIQASFEQKNISNLDKFVQIFEMQANLLRSSHQKSLDLYDFLSQYFKCNFSVITLQVPNECIHIINDERFINLHILQATDHYFLLYPFAEHYREIWGRQSITFKCKNCNKTMKDFTGICRCLLCYSCSKANLFKNNKKCIHCYCKYPEWFRKENRIDSNVAYLQRKKEEVCSLVNKLFDESIENVRELTETDIEIRIDESSIRNIITICNKYQECKACGQLKKLLCKCYCSSCLKDIVSLSVTKCKICKQQFPQKLLNRLEKHYKTCMWCNKKTFKEFLGLGCGCVCCYECLVNQSKLGISLCKSCTHSFTDDERTVIYDQLKLVYPNVKPFFYCCIRCFILHEFKSKYSCQNCFNVIQHLQIKHCSLTKSV